ncbi:MAG: RNA polymerase sigma factor [Pseudomonadota bacterium]
MSGDIRSAEPTSFADKLEECLPRLRAYSATLCHGKMADADDLVQIACMKAWSAREKYNPERPFRPWLFRILRNEFYSLKRKQSRTSNLDPDDIANVLDSRGNPTTEIELTQALIQLEFLPPKQRDAFILVALAEFSYVEAGAICGCSEGTVKSRVNRAKAALIRVLQRKEPTGQKKGNLAHCNTALQRFLHRLNELDQVVGCALWTPESCSECRFRSIVPLPIQ